MGFREWGQGFWMQGLMLKGQDFQSVWGTGTNVSGQGFRSMSRALIGLSCQLLGLGGFKIANA